MYKIIAAGGADERLHDTVIHHQHLGANYLFGRGGNHGRGGEGDIGDGKYDEAAANIGVLHFRYPGGSISEDRFDIQNPNSVISDFSFGFDTAVEIKDITPLDDFLTFVAGVNGKTSIVVPTVRFREAYESENTQEIEAIETQIRDFVRLVLNSKNADVINMFEIGNEFYDDKYNGDIPPEIYGRMANDMALWIAEEISHSSHDPDIAAQTAQSTGPNLLVIGEISNAALEVIDTLIVHNYRANPWEEREKGITISKGELVDDWENIAAKSFKTAFTEWNVRGSYTEGLRSGLPLAGSLLEEFSQQILAGMDYGHVWPLIQNTTNELADDKTNGDGDVGELRVMGVAYQQLIEHVIGKSAIEVSYDGDQNNDGIPEFLFQAYENPISGDTTVFVSSLIGKDKTFHLDLSALNDSTLGYQSMEFKTISLAGDNPLLVNNLGVVEEQHPEAAEGTKDHDGRFALELGAYQIGILDFSTDKTDLSYLTHERLTSIGSSSSDEINGWDGRDLVKAAGGNDVINTGNGRDKIFGGRGNDIIDGGADKDKIIAGKGRDKVFGGEGDDLLKGGQGNDLLFGGAGDDVVKGQAGDDILVGGAGNDKLFGGNGSDVFRFIEDDFGQDMIKGGFSIGEDRIVFRGSELVTGLSDLSIRKNEGDLSIEIVGASSSIIIKNGAGLAGLENEFLVL